MFVEREASVGEPISQERRNALQSDKRILGNVVQCDGARATISAYAEDADGTVTGQWTVGKMISINLGTTRTVGLVYEIGKSDRAWSNEGQNPIEVSIELIGEVRDGAE
ncbi:MAG: ATPase, partial [Mesorhizobium sp.]